MKKYFKLIVAAIIALIFIGTFVFLWQKSQPKEVQYSEFTTGLDSIRKTTIITGKIEPRNEVNIKPQISGIIAELYKEPGQYVNAGDIIAKVKVIPDMAQLSSAESRVRLSNINLKQVETDFSRTKNLHDQKLVSDEDFEKARQQLKQAQEENAAAVDALQVVRDGVSKSNASASSTLIRSTISGVILDIPVKVGNSVINSNTFNDGTTRSISRPRQRRAMVPTSLRSRQLLRYLQMARSVLAIVPTPRLCWMKPTMCSAYLRVPSSLVVTLPSSILLKVRVSRRPTSVRLWSLALAMA